MATVDIYTLKTCPYCVRAKQLLDSKGVVYQELKVDEKPELADEALQRSGGLKTLPQIFINDTHIGGFDDMHALDQEGKLDPMLAP